MRAAIVLGVLSFLYAGFFAQLMRIVARGNKAQYARAKGVLSSLFVVASVAAFYMGQQVNSVKYLFLLVALVLCACGDVFIGFANTSEKVSKKPFLIGGISFLLAHLVFNVLFSLESQFNWRNVILPALLLLLLLALDLTGGVRLKKARPLAYVYTFMVGIMASKAIDIGFTSALPLTAKVLLIAGAVSFLISDAILLFLYFGRKRHKVLRPANLTSYYFGIYLLALTAYWY